MGSSIVHIEDSRSYSVSLDRSRLGMTVTGSGPGVPPPDKDYACNRWLRTTLGKSRASRRLRFSGVRQFRFVHNGTH